MKILVLGGAGFIGRRLVHNLREKGNDVCAADIQGDAEYCDVKDFARVCTVVQSFGPEVIVHLSYIMGDVPKQGLHEVTNVNILGLQNALEAARLFDVQRVVYASSIAIYGDQSDFGDRVVTEDDYGRPCSYYGWTKQMNEAQARQFTRVHGIPTVGVRSATVFGPGREAGMSAVLNQIIEAGATGASVDLPIAPSQESVLIHVDDAAEVFAQLALAPHTRHDAYNTGGEFATAKDLADIVTAISPTTQISLDSSGNAPHIGQVSRVSWTRLKDEIDVKRESLQERVRGDIELLRAGGK